MIIPKKLRTGDEIRVIAPAESLSGIPDLYISNAQKYLTSKGFKVTFGRNVYEFDMFCSSSVNSRIGDLHDAFSDKNVSAIFTANGGFNSNQLLKLLDYDLIRKNPKIICGFSDITVLVNSIYAQTGIVTYLGPHFSTWAFEIEREYAYDMFYRSCVGNEDYFLASSHSVYEGSLKEEMQIKNTAIETLGLQSLQNGIASGQVLGGNLCSFNLLQGTSYMPDLNNSILFLEDDDLVGEYFPREFDRNLTSLIQQPGFEGVKGIIFGRFQKNAFMNADILRQIVTSKIELKNMPILMNANFGHIYPIATIPIGGYLEILAGERSEIKFISSSKYGGCS